MADSLGLSGSLETLTIAAENPEGGNIQLNTIIPDISSGLWSGKYYSDYPVTITAEAKPGYEFVGWTGDVQSNNSTIEIPIEKGGVSINAIFQRTTQ